MTSPLAKRFWAKGVGPVSNLLVFRFIITNTLLACLAGALWLQGYVWPVIEGGAPLNYGILGLFAVGFVWTAKEVLVVSSGLNDNTDAGAYPAIEAQRDKDTEKVAWLSSVSEWLAYLGLIGTVIGMIIALSGLRAVSDAAGALEAVSLFGEGMMLALNTTLLGASLAIWNEVNVRLLKTGLSTYWADRIAADHGLGKVRMVD